MTACQYTLQRNALDIGTFYDRRSCLYFLRCNVFLWETVSALCLHIESELNESFNHVRPRITGVYHPIHVLEHIYKL